MATQPKQFNSNGVEGIEYGGWKISCSKRTILNSEQLEEWLAKLQFKNLPEMVFGNNNLCLEHIESGFKLDFNTFDAMSAIDNTIILPKVAAAEEWIQSKASDLEGIKNVHNYDWSYTTPYKGTLHLSKDTQAPMTTTDKIDIERLKRPDPIYYFNEVHLYEDELADNGTSQLSVKVRVMPTCLFVLLRFWLRIDNVLFRLYETRIYHEFGTKTVLREWQAKESPFTSIARMLPPEQHNYSDVNFISGLLSQKDGSIEKISL